MTVQAHFCEIDDRVLQACDLRVLVQVLFWVAACGAV